MFSGAALPRVLPFAVYMAFIVVADVLARVGLSPDAIRWVYPIKILCVVAVLFFYRRAYVELVSLRLSMQNWLLAVLLGLAVWWLWIHLDADWMTVGTSAGFNPRNGGGIDWLLVSMRLFGAAIVVPLIEELFWRSFLLRWLRSADFVNADPRPFDSWAFVVSVLLFGIEHNLWLAGVVAGALYSLLYMYVRNLWAPIVAHAVTNGVLGIWILCGERWSFW